MSSAEREQPRLLPFQLVRFLVTGLERETTAKLTIHFETSADGQNLTIDEQESSELEKDI